MASTKRATIFTRTSHCLAAAALMAGVALATEPIAAATPDQSYEMSRCVNSKSGTFAVCCEANGGAVVTVPATDESSSYKTCTFPAQPASQEGSTPPKAGATVTQVQPPPRS